jgi:hypothetical protein
MKKKERLIKTSKIKERTCYQRKLRREMASGGGMTVFVFYKIYFGGYHDNAFKIELFEAPFTCFSNKSMSTRKILNIFAFSGSVWPPTSGGAHKLVERI